MRFGRRVRGNVSLETAVRGRIVMVTGASSGIGKSAAMKIADAGGTVLLVARTPEKLELTREQIVAGGGVAYIHQCDLSDFDDIDRMAEEVLAQHGHVDVLVNNAGRSIRRSIALSYDRPHDFERTIQLNYLGAVRLILKLLPVMRERKSGQIINVSSIGVQTNMPRFSAYVASKSALDAFCALHRLGDHRRRRPHHDDPHAAGADADDRADEDVRPLPDDHPGGGGGHDLRGDHPQAEADRDADGDARARSSTRSTRSRSTTSSTPPTTCSRTRARPRARSRRRSAGGRGRDRADHRRAGQQPAGPVREPDARRHW